MSMFMAADTGHGWLNELINAVIGIINPILIDTIGVAITSLERAVYERMMQIEGALQIKFYIDRAGDYGSNMLTSLSNSAKTGVDALDLAAVHGRNIPWNLAINKSL